MVILGIDPGLAIVGWGAVQYAANRFAPMAYGSIQTKAGIPVEDRLSQIYDRLSEIIEKYKPDRLSIEKLYFNTNSTTAIDVAQARGVILLAARKANLQIYEYTPLQVKQAVVGYGRADKTQVQQMVISGQLLK